MIFRNCFLILMMACSVLVSGPLENAEKAYQEKQYAESVQLYEAALMTTPSHAGLYYNLGNAYLKNKQVGLAITMYRRSLRIDPRDKATKINLNIARKLVLDETSPAQAPLMSWVIGFINSFTMNEYYSGLFLFLLGLNGLLIARYLDKRPDLLRQLFVSFAVAFSFFLILFITKINCDSGDSSGVLVIKKIDVKSGPSETLPTLFYIHEGVEFTLLKTVNEWSEIQLSNGYNGWILESSYLTI